MVWPRRLLSAVRSDLAISLAREKQAWRQARGRKWTPVEWQALGSLVRVGQLREDLSSDRPMSPACGSLRAESWRLPRGSRCGLLGFDHRRRAGTGDRGEDSAQVDRRRRHSPDAPASSLPRQFNKGSPTILDRRDRAGFALRARCFPDAQLSRVRSARRWTARALGGFRGPPTGCDRRTGADRAGAIRLRTSPIRAYEFAARRGSRRGSSGSDLATASGPMSGPPIEVGPVDPPARSARMRQEKGNPGVS